MTRRRAGEAGGPNRADTLAAGRIRGANAGGGKADVEIAARGEPFRRTRDANANAHASDVASSMWSEPAWRALEATVFGTARKGEADLVIAGRTAGALLDRNRGRIADVDTGEMIATPVRINQTDSLG